MGVYYGWVNIDKHEYHSPVDSDEGSKLFETTFAYNALTGALYNLLSSDWKNDKVLFFGDETNIPDDIDNSVLSQLHKERMLWDEPGFEMDYIFETYRCVSGLFVKAKEEVLMETGYKFEDGTYNSDLEVPFEDLFTRDSKFFRFTINHTKREYFDTEQTIVDGDFNFNPLPLLMSYSRSKDVGSWIGDTIEVADTLSVKGYRNISFIQSLYDYR